MEKQEKSPKKGAEEEEEEEESTSRNSNNNNNSTLEEVEAENVKSKKKKQRKQREEEEEPAVDDPRAAFFQNLLNAMLLGRRAASNSNEEMVQGLKDSGVLNSKQIEEALLLLPRGSFVPKEVQEEAYIDSPIRVASMGFNISAPHMYAVCLENLALQPGMSFLDIGSGCGHFTALGGFLVGKEGISHGLEVREDIVQLSEKNVRDMEKESGLDLGNVKFFIRNCFLPTTKPILYDRIHVGACCPSSQIDNLYKLLKPGGVLVTPYKDHLVRATKDANGEMKIDKLMAVRYGDLVVPSEAEVKEALRLIERQKAITIVVPPSSFVSDFAKLINNKELSDVTFTVEGKPVYAHKTILAARCDHFKAMFFNGLRESHENNVSLEGIPNLSYDLFIDCLHEMYTGEVTIKTPDHAIELIAAANYFKLDRLKALCEDIIKNNVEIENAAYIFQVSSQYEAWQLKSFTLDFMMHHYEEVLDTKCFDELDKPLLKEVTQAACKFLKTLEK